MSSSANDLWLTVGDKLKLVTDDTKTESLPHTYAGWYEIVQLKANTKVRLSTAFDYVWDFKPPLSAYVEFSHGCPTVWADAFTTCTPLPTSRIRHQDVYLTARRDLTYKRALLPGMGTVTQQHVFRTQLFETSFGEITWHPNDHTFDVDGSGKTNEREKHDSRTLVSALSW